MRPNGRYGFRMESNNPQSEAGGMPSGSPDRAEIATRVTAALRNSGMTQVDIASYLGLSRKTIERRLKGEREFTANEIGLLARKLNVPVADLLGNVA